MWYDCQWDNYSAQQSPYEMDVSNYRQLQKFQLWEKLIQYTQLEKPPTFQLRETQQSYLYNETIYESYYDWHEPTTTTEHQAPDFL